MYFPFFKLKKWGKKTAEARRHNCAVLPYDKGVRPLVLQVSPMGQVCSVSMGGKK